MEFGRKDEIKIRNTLRSACGAGVSILFLLTIIEEMVNKSILVKLFGYRASLIHHDTLVLDRWIWPKSRLPKTAFATLFLLTSLESSLGDGSFPSSPSGN